MPPLPRQPVPMLAALEDELRYAPREARLRVIDRAERLCETIDDGTTYPAAWVVAAVTGFQPTRDEGGAASGRELRRGLAALVERQSDLANLTPVEAEGGVEIPDVLARWRVSRATLGRLRHFGLPARRIRDGRGAGRVVFMPRALAWFERVHADRLARAGTVTRVTEGEAERLARRAARYQRCLRWPATRIIARLAERGGRSREGVRQVLLRSGVFDRSPHLDGRLRRILAWQWRRGVDVGRMSRGVRRSRGAVRRAIHVERARRLVEHARAGGLAGPVGPTFELRDAADPILAPRAVRDCAVHVAAEPIAALLAEARSGRPPIAAAEQQRAVAFHFLRWRARVALAGLNPLNPSAVALDRIETDLRWAARLRIDLARAQWAVIVRTLEARLERRLEDLPARDLASVLAASVIAAAGVVEVYDPFKGGRLAGAAGLAVDKVAGAWLRAGRLPRAAATRAAVVLSPDTVLPDWTRGVPSPRWLEPPGWVRDAALRAGGGDGALLRARFGWGEPPHTLGELARRFGLAPTRVAIEEAAAVRRTMPR